MRELMNLVNDIAPLVKIEWLIFFVWALVQIAWYRRAHVVTWPKTGAAVKPTPRRVVPPVARTAAPPPHPARTPEPALPIEPIVSRVAAAAEPNTNEAPAPKPSRRRRRAARAARAATAGA